MKQSEIKVDFINSMGDDLTVVNVARVSFDKESEWQGTMFDPELADKDKKLIKYLAAHGHWSPFSHCFVQFRIKAPIFVARQLVKHQVGLSWNEVSRRYVDSEPEFYLPDYWRKRAASVKQGSSEEDAGVGVFYAHNTASAQLGEYNYLLDLGVCPEQARMVLPQNMMTEWYWSGSLYAFARICNQRLDSHSQKETREVAEQIYEHLKQLFPESCKHLIKQGD